MTCPDFVLWIILFRGIWLWSPVFLFFRFKWKLWIHHRQRRVFRILWFFRQWRITYQWWIRIHFWIQNLLHIIHCDKVQRNVLQRRPGSNYRKRHPQTPSPHEACQEILQAVDDQEENPCPPKEKDPQEVPQTYCLRLHPRLQVQGLETDPDSKSEFENNLPIEEVGENLQKNPKLTKTYDDH